MPDGQVAKLAMKETTNYYQADVTQKGYTQYTDDDGIVYTSNDAGKYTGSDGKTYKLDNNTFTEIAAMAMRLAMEEQRQLQKIRKKKLRQLTVMEIQHCLIQPVQQICSASSERIIRINLPMTLFPK